MTPLQGLHTELAALFHGRGIQFTRAENPSTSPQAAHDAKLLVQSLDKKIATTQTMISEDLVIISKIEDLAAMLENSDSQTRPRAIARQSLEGAALWLRKEIGDVPPANFRETVSSDHAAPENTPSPGLAGVSEAGSPPLATDEPAAPISGDHTGVFDS
jgi:hypothetical protein